MIEDIDTEETTRTAHAATQTLGLGLIAGSLSLMIVVSLALFGGEDIAPFAVVVLLAAAATVLTWRVDRQWARALGLVATVLTLMGFFLAFGVFHPFSPLEFIVGLAYAIGVIMSLVAGVRAIIAGRRGRTERPGSARRTRLVVAGVLGAATVISIAGFLLTRETVDAELAAGATVVEMKDFEFVPADLEVHPGDQLLLKNSDPFTHDFTLEAFDIDVTVGPGSEALVAIPADASGTYAFVCTLHSDGDSGMQGTLTLDG